MHVGMTIGATGMNDARASSVTTGAGTATSANNFTVT